MISGKMTNIRARDLYYYFILSVMAYRWFKEIYLLIVFFFNHTGIPRWRMGQLSKMEVKQTVSCTKIFSKTRLSAEYIRLVFSVLVVGIIKSQSSNITVCSANETDIKARCCIASPLFIVYSRTIVDETWTNKKHKFIIINSVVAIVKLVGEFI